MSARLRLNRWLFLKALVPLVATPKHGTPSYLGQHVAQVPKSRKSSQVLNATLSL